MPLDWKKITLTPEQKDLILQMRAEGISYRAISHKLKVSKNFVHRKLKEMNQIHLKDAAMRKRFLDSYRSFVEEIAASDSRQIKSQIRKLVPCKDSEAERYENIVLNQRLVFKFNEYYISQKKPHIKAWLDEYGDMQTNVTQRIQLRK